MNRLTRHKEYSMIAILAILMSVLSVSCRTAADSDLAEALSVAGDNRWELEAVLDHYADDPEKLEAAQILIRNMPGHYSFADAELMERYHQRADSFITTNPQISSFDLCDSIDALADRMGVLRVRKVSDCQVMIAGYLTDNIDRAFEQWRSNPWLRHLNFEQFCEYVLPYKVKELQPLDDWRRV